MTRVSVGLPVFNGGRYLEEALGDLLAQTHDDLEIVISDNGSTDATQAICLDHAARDSRIRYHRQPVNRGASWNHNEVVRLAGGPYFRWYSYDDRLDPECVAEGAAVLDARPEVVLAWPLTTVIDGEGRFVREYRDDLPWDPRTAVTRLESLLGPRTDESLLHMCYPVYGVMRLDVLRRTRLLGRMPGADTVLLVELAMQGPWAVVPRRLFVNRRHAWSSAMDKTPEQIAAWFDPRQRGVHAMPHLRQWWGYVGAVARASLPPAERLKAMRVVLRWLTAEGRARVVLGEVRVRIRDERLLREAG